MKILLFFVVLILIVSLALEYLTKKSLSSMKGFITLSWTIVLFSSYIMRSVKEMYPEGFLMSIVFLVLSWIFYKQKNRLQFLLYSGSTTVLLVISLLNLFGYIHSR
ncbi:hypothetical protein CEB3_c19840 [Peptococcaceae bacterium CEB3]|nr:hypothetical protein CEB3_c19840 [Peptococcaceae bacterium CEB3]